MHLCFCRRYVHKEISFDSHLLIAAMRRCAAKRDRQEFYRRYVYKEISINALVCCYLLMAAVRRRCYERWKSSHIIMNPNPTLRHHISTGESP